MVVFGVGSFDTCRSLVRKTFFFFSCGSPKTSFARPPPTIRAGQICGCPPLRITLTKRTKLGYFTPIYSDGDFRFHFSRISCLRRRVFCKSHICIILLSRCHVRSAAHKGRPGGRGVCIFVFFFLFNRICIGTVFPIMLNGYTIRAVVVPPGKDYMSIVVFSTIHLRTVTVGLNGGGRHWVNEPVSYIYIYIYACATISSSARKWENRHVVIAMSTAHIPLHTPQTTIGSSQIFVRRHVYAHARILHVHIIYIQCWALTSINSI